MRSVPHLLALGLALSLVTPARAAFDRTAVPDTVIDPCSPGRHVPIGWELRPARPCNGDSVSVIFRSCRECVDLIAIELSPGSVPVILTRSPKICPLAIVCLPDSLILPIGRFAAGNYLIKFDVRNDVVSNDSVLCTRVEHDSLAFSVGSCQPPPGPLPFVTDVRIGRPGPCLACRPHICPGDSIPVFVTGIFPDDCFRLRRIEVLPFGPEVIPPPGSPPYFVRLIVDDMACVGRLCVRGDFPFAGFAVMPPLSGGSYALTMIEARVSCSDSVRDQDSMYVAHFPFAVAERCSVTSVPSCLLPDFGPRSGDCDAFVTLDHPDSVLFGVRSGVALAGLEGAFTLEPPGLRIRNLEAIGAAAGMHLAWRSLEGGGARFVMFAESGAPIPPTLRDPGAPAAPVLRITVEQPAGVKVGRLTLLRPSVLGSDSDGIAVPECPTASLIEIAARVCSGAPCDFNGDGVEDIRDLVTMVHCVLHTGTCPDTAADFDCNHDGRETIDDVLCCARTILTGGGGEHDSVPGRPEPGIQLSFGEPVRTTAGVDVPIHLTGADRIGAARLALRYPQSRFESGAVELKAGSSNWLALDEAMSDALVVGLIGMGQGGTQSASPELDLVLHLTLKPGQEPGGELQLSSSQFSGPDGAALKVDLGSPALGFSGDARFTLSPGRPNPFSLETRFALSLTRAADVDVVVHDLSGRRVAVLEHGHLEAGGHALSWNGTRGDGSRVPEGVYFVRARVAGRVSSTRVVLLRGK